MVFDNIPDELKRYRQFCVWRYEEPDGRKLTKVPYCPTTGHAAAVDDPSTWVDFNTACRAVVETEHYSGIGFVLTENDPFAFIDLDNPGDDKDAMDKQLQIYNEFDSYAELSPSGNGLHILVYGQLKRGRRRGKIEVYSSGRYMTMTGNVYRHAPIRDCNVQLNSLYDRLGEGRNLDMFYAGAEAERFTDEKLIEVASTAANAEKFNDLFYHGNWQGHYPSQSEADFALFDIIAFYSQNGQQTQRIFLQSALAQREKSRAQYRINYMLARCFDRMIPPVDYEALRERVERVIEEKARRIEPSTPFPTNGIQQTPIIEQKVNIEQPIGLKLPGMNEPITMPPGLVGEIAEFIYAQAPRPVKEIALITSLGITGGVCGRSFNVSGTGLNQYFVLLANTGTGKEASASGANKLFHSIAKQVPSAKGFLGPGTIQSSQALMNHLAKKQTSFCSILGEFSEFFSQMGNPKAAPNMKTLKALMLQLYSKSGYGMRFDDVIWADKDKNIEGIVSPAFSFVGECTPQKFYEALHDGMIEEGLLPRFTIIEYDGPRVPENKNHMMVQPSFGLVERFSSLCAHSIGLNTQNKAIDVKMNEEATELFELYNVFCDNQINTTSSSVRKHLWTRARLSAMKLAALVAVGLNPYSPSICKNCAYWAIALINRGASNIIDKFSTGDVGTIADEDVQITKLVSTIREYATLEYGKIAKYMPSNGEELYKQKLIPYSYLQKKLTSALVFKNDRLGPTNAIKRGIKTLCDRGDLQEVQKSILMKNFNTVAMTFAISDAKLLG